MICLKYLHKIYSVFLLIFLFFCITSCSLFSFLFTPKSNANSTILFEVADPYRKSFSKYHIPTTVGSASRWAVLKDLIIISNPIHQTVDFFSKEGLLDKILLTSILKKSLYSKKLPIGISTVISDKFVIPGDTVRASDNTFFLLNGVQNFSKHNKKNIKSSFLGYSLLLYDTEGNFIYQVNNKSQKTNFFENVLWFDIDKKGYLWVLHSSWGRLILDQFDREELLFSFTDDECTQILLLEVPQEEEHVYSCKKMYPFLSGDTLFLLGNVQNFTKDKKYKEVTLKSFLVSYDLNTKKSVLLFKPKSVLKEEPYFPYKENKWFNLKTINYNSWEYILYNFSRKPVQNITFDLPESSQYLRSTYITLQGNIYSIYKRNTQEKIYKWSF